MDNLSSWWNFIGIAIALLGVLISWKQNKSKKLSYSVISYPLFEIKDSLKNDLEIRYKNEIVNQVYTCIINVKNFGNQSIRKEDFDEPITFQIQNCKHIFSVENISTSPKKLVVNIEVKGNTLKINSMLLNPTDYFTLKLILEGENILVNVDTRIIGIKEIQNKKDLEEKSNKIKGVFILISGILIWTFHDALILILNSDFAAVILLIGIFCIGYGIASTSSTIISSIKNMGKSTACL